VINLTVLLDLLLVCII